MATDIIDVTVSAADVPVCTLTTGAIVQATVTGISDMTNGIARAIKVEAKTNMVKQRIDGSIDGTIDDSATMGVTYTKIRVGCSGTGLTQQPGGLISDLRVFKDVI
jgi:hypothetical protein